MSIFVKPCLRYLCRIAGSYFQFQFLRRGQAQLFQNDRQQKVCGDYILHELETMLDPAFFFRVNRSAIVSMRTIVQVDEYVNNRLILRLKVAEEKEIIVSRDRVSAFKDWLGK